MSAEESTQNESQLAADAVARDEIALSKLLYLHHGRLVAQIAARLPADLQGSVSAEDIAQEAYVVAFQRISTFDPRDFERFDAWLASIARNRLMDAVKAQRAAKRGGGAMPAIGALAGDDDDVVGLLEVLASHSRTPSRSAAGHEAAQAVERGLAGLQDDYAQALRLRYVQGLSVAEAAEQMQRSEGAVQMLCHRGLQALRETLGDASSFLSRKS